MLRRWWCEQAWLPPGRVASGVLVEAEADRITSVTCDTPQADATRLAGLTLPGLANAHSHAFHRALRGRTQSGGGSFWTWREQMYAVSDRLDPDSYLALARATYAEMVLAGITCVGEFHYLHHGPRGVAYADPNAMGSALLQAAADAGLRITLLDACYLTGGIGRPLGPSQLRFGDGDADSWAQRVSMLTGGPHARIAAAAHSVRAVPAEALRTVADWAESRRAALHIHLSEQPAENSDCAAAYGLTPTRLLAEHGFLTARTTSVHATHVTEADIGLLGSSRTAVCLCPTTERDLADGIGPGRRLADAGSPLCLGSDSQSVIDVFEEARAVELDERLASGQRGHFAAADLMDAATVRGHASLGWPDAGVLAVGHLADLVTVRMDSPRTAGVPADAVVYSATSADVTDVVIGGRPIVCDGRHLLVPDVGHSLADAIGALR